MYIYSLLSHLDCIKDLALVAYSYCGTELEDENVCEYFMRWARRAKGRCPREHVQVRSPSLMGRSITSRMYTASALEHVLEAQDCGQVGQLGLTGLSKVPAPAQATEKLLSGIC